MLTELGLKLVKIRSKDRKRLFRRVNTKNSKSINVQLEIELPHYIQTE